MSAADEAESLLSRHHDAIVYTTKVCAVETSGRRELVDALLSHGDIIGTSIATILKREGIDVPAASLNRHRRGACQCR